MSDRSVSSPEPIAIVGIANRFPGATAPNEFWQLMKDRRDLITEVPASRFDTGALYDPSGGAGKLISKWGGFIDRVDEFDAGFFGITGREARHMDPQQRLALEVAVDALMNAGLRASALSGSAVGVFVGVATNEYQELEYRDVADPNVLIPAGGTRNGIAGRISYCFRLQGPSMAIDTDRSSSLVAVHLAAASVRRGESSVALVGATNLVLTPEPSIALSRANMLSPDGRCKFGDARANGFVRSDGVAFLVLKKLSDALADGDRIYATILGSAVNHDAGRSGDFLAPSGASQIALLEGAYRDAGVHPADVQYVEAHGPGTQRGDPEEIRALATVLQRGRAGRPPLRVGSVKTNIGHAEAAAGLAGLIKTVLSIWHRTIPASLHFETPNPKIDFDGIVVPTETTEWPDTSRSLVAGVTSLGLTGTNAHIVVGEAPPSNPAEGAPEREELLAISAKSAASLTTMVERYIEVLADPTASVHDLAYSAAVRRDHHAVRLAVVGSTREDLATQLRTSLGRARSADTAAPSKVAFVFPGHGSQWLGMGRELMARESAFRSAIERCHDSILRVAGWSLIDELMATSDRSRLNDFRVIQPTLVAMEIGLAAQWQAFGIEPELVIGTSMGEIAAAQFAGLLSLDDAMKVICRRSELMHAAWNGKSGMGVVGLPASQVVPYLEGRELWVAGINSPVSTIIAGAPAALDEVMRQVKAAGVNASVVKDVLSSHTPHVDAIVDALGEALREVVPTTGRLPMMSSVTGEVVRNGLGGSYWVRNMREPILFANAMQQLLEAGYDMFVEVSPHPLLVGPILDCVAAAGCKARAIGTLRRNEPERRAILRSVGALYERGLNIDWARFFSVPRPLADLPTYAWDRKRYWYDDAGPRMRAPRRELEDDAPSTATTESVAPPPQTFGQTLSRLPPRERRAALLDHVRSQLSSVLGAASEGLDVQRPLRDLGLTSFLGVELASLLSASLGRTLAPTLVFNHPTIDALVEFLAREDTPVAASPIGEIFVDAGILSEADLRSALAEQARSQTKERLGAVLLRMGLVTADQLHLALSHHLAEPIAIVGMGCRFPGASSPEDFWSLMDRGVDAIGDVPAWRWSLENIDSASPNAASIGVGGFVDAIDQFDAAFFGITPREAEEMDPQQRLLLEVASEALEHAAQSRDELVGSRTGVFIGISNNNDYASVKRLADSPSRVRAHHGTGMASSVAAGRLAYTLGLNGPAVAIDAACASSLVAVHLAMQSLRAGECRVALAGGVNAILSPEVSLAYSQAGMLSPRGRCRTFDATADGYVRSEGCGVVILKRLSDARAHGDNVLAVLVGSAVNQNGRGSGLTAPNGAAQQALVRQALASAGVHPSEVGYVEAQGTGTPLGDSVEIQALGEVLKEGRSATKPFVVGSVKTNIGHMEAAAGIAGLMKVVLSLQHGRIPRHLHLSRVNPLLGAETLPMTIPSESMAWPNDGHRRIAGVSAFGFGGTNCHVVVESAPEAPPVERGVGGHRLPFEIINVSARTPEALADLLARHGAFLENQPGADLGDVGYTASVGRAHYEERVAVVATSTKHASDLLKAAAGAQDERGIVRGRSEAAAPRIGFVFSGVGAGYVGMGRALYEKHPVFKAALDECASLLDRHLEVPLLSSLYPSGVTSGAMHRPTIAEPALFAVEYALAQLWRALGIVPEAVLGFGVGEYVAACVAGLLRLEDATRAVVAYGRLREGMGERPSDQGSPPALEELDGILRASRFGHPTIGVVSGVTGSMAGEELASIDHWRRHAVAIDREPEAGIRSLTQHGVDSIIEIGPGDRSRTQNDPALHGCPRSLSSIREGRDDWEVLLHAVADLHVRGATIDWKGFYAPLQRRRVDLPTYAWQRKRHWVDTSRSLRRAARETGHPLLGVRIPVAGGGRGRRRGEGAAKVFETVLSVNAFPYLADHVVHGKIVVPVAAYLELARAAGEVYWGPGAHRLSDFVVQSLLSLSGNEGRRVQVVLSEDEEETVGDDEQRLPIAVYSQRVVETSDDVWILHAQGHIHRQPLRPLPSPIDLETSHMDFAVLEDGGLVYESLHDCGLEYGSAFRLITGVARAGRKGRARLHPASAVDGYGLHPTVLEAGFQALQSLLQGQGDDAYAYATVEVKDFTLWSSAGVPSWLDVAVGEAAETNESLITGQLAVLDDTGNVLAEVRDIKLKRLEETAAPSRAAARREALYQLEWREVSPRETNGTDTRGVWIVLTDGSDVGEELVARLEGAAVRVIANRAPSTSIEDFERQLVEAVDAGTPIESVVCFWRGHPTSGAIASAEELAVRGLDQIRAIVRTTNACESSPRLWWITEGAQGIRRDESVDIAGASLWGIGRTLTQEHPELACTLVDLDPTSNNSAALLWDELWAATEEPERALRGDGCFVPRLARSAGATLKASNAGRSGSFDPQSTILITGGPGRPALRIAECLMARHGVLHFALVEPHPMTETDRERIERLRQQGSLVTFTEADVADGTALQAVIAAIPADRPLRTIVHAAGVIDDGVLTSQTPARLTGALTPKLRGAWNLHELTRDTQLDNFVLFSSICALVGSTGQASTAAADAVLDALAQARRAAGLPAVSIHWGPLEGERPDQKASDRPGEGLLRFDAALDLLGSALACAAPQLACLALDLRALRGPGKRAPLWSELAPRERRKRPAVDQAGARLKQLTPEVRVREMEASIRMHVAKIAGLPSANDVPLKTPLRDVGLDSVMVVELRNRLSAELGVSLPTTLVFDYPTIAKLTEYLFRRLETSSATAGRRAFEEPIAIIGMSCRLPGGANDPELFWELLSQGKDAITPIPPDRWDIDAYYDADPDAPGKMYVRNGGFLSDIELFDAPFFGISPREAEAMDPQQRLLLEVAFDALARAGQIPARLEGSLGGVFLGISLNEYLERAKAASAIDVYTYTGNALAVASGRIAYVLGWEGPAVTIDTACSSSLVAVHQAAKALRAGECDIALAGGANLMLSPETTVSFCRIRALATDGHCKTFDASANGYVRSDGCGVIVLKRLSEAQAAGDPILAVIRGSAINQDGRSNGLTAPNGLAQQKVIRSALEHARVKPSELSYVEAHGTGTPLGDPIEMQALGSVFGQGRTREQPLLVGSVKSNIGHTEAAAGIAGLIKIVLAMKAKQIPPNLNFREPSPHIPWSDLPVRIPTTLEAWPSNGQPYLAGISSFGISGTNAHLILESAPSSASVRETVTAEAGAHLPLCISAKTPEALTEYAARYAAYLAAPIESDATWHDVSYSTSLRRSTLERRLVVMGSSAEEWREKLLAFTSGETRRGLVVGEANDANAKVVFVFPGQGSQWLGMGRSLLRSSAVFREHIERCERAFQPHVDWSLLEQIHADPTSSRLTEVQVIQPMVFALQTGLAAVWASLGVVPDAIIGHSMGEVAASFVAGALTLEDAARVICVRSRLATRVRGRGTMAAVEMSMAQCEKELAAYGGKISVAASNGPRSTVVAGETAAIAALIEDFKRREIFCRPIKVDFASHSSQVDELKDALLEELAPVRPRVPTHRFLSTCIVASDVEPRLDAAYWWSNLREPVRLSQRVEELIGTGHTLFVEVSPHPVLTVGLEETLRAGGVRAPVIPSLRREEPEWEVMHESLATLFVAGYPIDWTRKLPEAGRVVRLPDYPWQRERHWVPQPKRTRTSRSAWSLIDSHLETSDQPSRHVFELELDLENTAHAYVVDHKVQGDVWLPGAAFVEMAFEAGRMLNGDGASAVEHLKLEQPVVLKKGETTRVQLVIDAEGDGKRPFRVASRAANDSNAAWTAHAGGTLVGAPHDEVAAPTSLDAVKQQCPRSVDVGSLYDDFARKGIAYGPAFQGIAAAWAGESASLAKLESAGELSEHTGGYVIHPSVLDAAFQSLYIAAQKELGSERTFVPSTIGRLRVTPNRVPRWAHATLRSSTADSVTCDVVLLGDEGDVVGRIESMCLVALSRAGDRLDNWVFDVSWQTSARKTGGTAEGRWLLLADEQGVAEGLRSELEARGAQVITVTRGPNFRKTSPTSYDVDVLDAAAVRRLLEDALRDSPPKRIVHLSSLDTRTSSLQTLDDAAALRAEDLACTSLLHLTQAISQTSWPTPPRLFIATRGSQAATGSQDVVFPEQALAWGFAATIVHEMPELRTTVIDLEEESLSSTLADELTCADDETRVALRGSERFVPRLARATPVTPATGGFRPLTVGDEEGYRLDATELGRTDSLTLQPTPVPVPGPGQVVVRTRASGINFRDVLTTIGMLKMIGMDPGLVGTTRPPMGMGTECSGIVHAVGPGVDRLRPGDEVVAASFYGFDAYVVVPEPLVIKKPASVSFEQAAAFPTVAMTVLYALERVGRLRKGERVLIHAATGGVGLAAVQYAKHVGAVIHATAGSEEKRAYLRALGIAHVYDSRTLEWADELQRDTGGRGVDVVLNSLSGEGLRKGVAALASFGRFLELGKRDIYENSGLGLYAIRNNITISAVAIEKLMAERPEDARTLLEDAFRMIEQGVWSPLPMETFPISRAADAFEHLARARHIGKIVLVAEDQVTVRDAARSEHVRADRTYLVTGGLGGLGLVVAERLAKLGAKHLALMGRTAPSPSAMAKIRSLEDAGTRVHLVRADVGNRQQVADALAQLGTSAPPVEGVVHAAGVLDDGTLSTLSRSRIGPVLRPKLLGALALASALPNLSMRVYFSSVTGLLGSGGQAHYSAANAFLDAFAHHLVSRSARAISLDWGVWAEVGLAARGDRVDNVSRQGLATLSPDDGAELFARLVSSDRAQLAPVPIDFRQWRQANPQAAGIPFLRNVIATQAQRSTQKNTSLFERIQSATESDRTGIIEEYLSVTIAGILRSSATSIQRSAPFKQLGFDSLMVISLKNVLERDTALPISTGNLYAYPSVEKLAHYVNGKLSAHTTTSQNPVVVEAPTLTIQETDRPESVEDLTDAEVSAQLAATLQRLQILGDDNG